MALDLPVALVVDDDPAVRAIVGKLLQGFGYQVAEASDGRAGLETLRVRHPVIVCLDLMLPEMDGYELLELIRRTPELAATPVLIMSARGLPEDRAIAEELGVAAYLQKPFTPTQFRAGVRQVVGEAALPARRPS